MHKTGGAVDALQGGVGLQIGQHLLNPAAIKLLQLPFHRLGEAVGRAAGEAINNLRSK